jgi:excisionase family DNA binding protein
MEAAQPVPDRCDAKTNGAARVPVSNEANRIGLGTARFSTRGKILLANIRSFVILLLAAQMNPCNPAQLHARRTSVQRFRYPMEIQPLFYSKQASARILGISERTVHLLIAKKLLGAKRVGRRVLVAHEELLRFAKQRISK